MNGYLLTSSELDKLRSIVLADFDAHVRTQPKVDAHLNWPFDANVSVPYGQLHEELVDTIRARHLDNNLTVKGRILKALTEMADKGALYPGDSEQLQELVDATLIPEIWTDHSSEKCAEMVLPVVMAVHRSSMKIRSNPNASAASRAIADTTAQSATQGAAIVANEDSAAKAKSAWRTLVLKDVEGAFEGGATAAGIAPVFGALPPAMPIVTAFGVVIGAGIRSGIAYSEK